MQRLPLLLARGSPYTLRIDLAINRPIVNVALQSKVT
jgi:hypothetical protein